MAQGKVRLNKAVIGRILKTVDGGKRAAAERIIAAMPQGTEARIEVYQTDREVVGIVVPFEDQAMRGVATRAAGDAGVRSGRAG